MGSTVMNLNDKVGMMQLRKAILGLVALLGMAGLGRISAQDQDQPKDTAPKINSSLVNGLGFRNIGPALMSGRIVDIAVDPEQSSTWYLAVASGGVWKTVNAGTTWSPIFDSYPSYSIGCVVVDPKNRNVVWVGTGENNSQRSVGYGDGIYKSLDGGQSFQRVGLEKSEHIGKILIDPRNSDVVYVASQGPLWSSGGERGLYKTVNGGRTWDRILHISDHTGISDIAVDPRDPDVVYAVAYQRRRHQWTLIDGGPESGIHKSTDGGKTWKAINKGLPGGDKGRIGIAVSPMQPDVVYTIVEAQRDQGGFYRSVDRGETWVKQSSYVSGSPQYYQEIFADPNVMDRIYSMDTMMQVSDDGGKTFRPAGEANKHVDNHALFIDPNDSNHLLVGCDGGLYETFDRCKNFRYFENLPITQFYKIAVDNSEPFFFVYGGTQDNATQGGPSRTNNVHGIRNSDWFVTVFGDGFDPAVDPEDPNIVYSQSQYGGLIRFDRRTGEQVDIKPQESLEGPALRWHWDSALALSPHQTGRIYYGSQILFRSDDRGDTWEAISPDLTRGINRNELKVMDRVWGIDAVAKNTSTSFYGSIVAISESPLADGLIYAGTDDGMIQVTEDGGENWTKIDQWSQLDVPEFSYVSDIEASLHNPDVVYAVLQNFKRGDFKPYVLKSEDRGQHWINISKGLPVRGSTYTIVEDHEKAGLLFVGTEFGLFVTLDDGQKWLQMTNGIPTIAIRDLEIQRRDDALAVGTFGRGILILDDYSPLRHMSEEMLEKPATVFPIKPVPMYLQQRPLALGAKAFQGASFFTADNPPFGATFTFYLRESLKSKKSERQAKDSEAARKNQDARYPSWENLKAEDREESPAVWITIRDSEGQVVRKLKGPTSSGVHRLTWDLHHAGLQPSDGTSDGRGPLAMPGTYTMAVSKWVDGEVTELSEPVTFECYPLGMAELSDDDRRASQAFQKETAELQRVLLASNSVLQNALERVRAMKGVMERSPRLDIEMRKEARTLELKLMDLQEVLAGDTTRAKRQEPAMPGLLSRLDQVVGGHWSTTSGPTTTQRQQFEIVSEQLTSWIKKLRPLVEQDLIRMEKKLEAAGAPWTDGRALPKWPPK